MCYKTKQRTTKNQNHLQDHQNINSFRTDRFCYNPKNTEPPPEPPKPYLFRDRSSSLPQPKENEEHRAGNLQPHQNANSVRPGVVHAGSFTEGPVVAVVFVHTGEGAVLLHLVVMATVLADLVGGSAAAVEIGRVSRFCGQVGIS